MTSNTDNFLYLYSTDLTYFPENISQFIQQCQQYEFIGQAANNLGQNYYHIGDKFLNMVTFMGCSPYLKIYPENENDTDYCSAYISDDTSVTFINSNSNTGPRCPNCRKLVRSESELWKDWHSGNEKKSILCEHCNTSISFQDLDWRKNAGLVNFTIRISNIFPKEAIPSEQLLSQLKLFTNVEWKYFYA